ncbi:PLATZ transcription factor family protein [Striga asiatica]|uniref:PLATZ transcription factor family protein n=1 Tax=Striga asiatica TaxID=4170 RepID=A0A5A7R0Q0_STRAF|nr:PLATZ transcription factor family protein [Striga asiatica]
MSATAKEVMKKIDHIVQKRICPKWIESFLGKTFFEKCPSHNLGKNELNRYCITCDESFCRHCITYGYHKGHDILPINRYTYQNAVPLNEMEVHIDCQNIQVYKCNSKPVLCLNTIRHSDSGLLADGKGKCHVCERKLTNLDRFQFCSIACKIKYVNIYFSVQIQAVTEPIHFLALLDVEEPINPSKRKRSRKGVPTRAPFF